MSLAESIHPPVDAAVPRVERQYGKSFVERWDDLIDWRVRSAGEGAFFRDRLAGIGARRVLDTATGTGFHAIDFAKAGYDVTAIDLVPSMVARARSNAAQHGAVIAAFACDWRNLADCVSGPFDALVCLGSSFPHLVDASERAVVLRTFRSILRPGGLLMLDHRNFDAIRAGHYANTARLYYGGGNVAVSAASAAGLCTFTYDFRDGARFQLRVADIPTETMRREIAVAGFGPVETYGDFRPVFDPMDVGFLIHIAQAE
ncbi:class I SAM-dependent methyltransferase [Jiella sp. MQZ9-1]|uniref:Class I SAM-dependent methyltransferase n=1 Tax=Jiella flava TaxID=2816857 RepID=A0A939FZW3_9HYPH|nr:class I SAM-dependent methyltransferase [Jiella flava]MBO0664557.1 class I SAM-dependent methyltransferase [Jiella flava]MCD2473178.1 class I SAM-dependent methyltransferase [Jiella flava]